MLRVGLTGGLGSGKSTVAAILRDVKNDDETAHLCEPAPSGGGVTLQ